MKQNNAQKGDQNRKIGALGEEIAERFLVEKGFEILDRNYKKKWGEIDIVAEKEGKIVFIEVKTVSCETNDFPEERVDEWKMKRLSRAVSSYLAEKDVSPETPWQCDVLGVFLDRNTKKAKIRRTENVLFE